MTKCFRLFAIGILVGCSQTLPAPHSNGDGGGTVDVEVTVDIEVAADVLEIAADVEIAADTAVDPDEGIVWDASSPDAKKLPDAMPLDLSADLLTLDLPPDTVSFDSLVIDTFVPDLPPDSSVVPDAALNPGSLGWTFHTANPVLEPTPLSFDQYGVQEPVVIKMGSIYKMWYAGRDQSKLTRVGYATSPDGITWNHPTSGAVLTLGNQGSFDAKGVSPAEVMYDLGIYKMWYIGESAAGDKRSGYASSHDGISWTRLAGGQSIMSPGAPGAWDESLSLIAAVAKDGTGFSATYFGGNSGGVFGYGWATSNDGVSWTKAAGNPISVVPNHAMPSGVGSLIKTGSTYHHYYSFYSSVVPALAGVYYQSSVDGINWISHPQNPVIATADFAPWTLDRLLGISVIREDSTSLKMWYGGAGLVTTTDSIGLAYNP
jgi:hypothetical protein